MLSLLVFQLKAQKTHYMSNATVNECNGIFKDSEAGLTKGYYDHNESFIFTICVPGALNISVIFKSFNTEAGNDVLEAFDGNGTGAKKLGTWSGKKSPGTVASSGTCITFKFTTDKSVALDGWEAEWVTSIKQILPPKLTLNTGASCNDKEVILKMDSKVNCDSIKKYASYKLSGPNSPTITSFTPVSCDSDNKTDLVKLTLSKDLTRSGRYKVRYVTVVPDPCDSLRVFNDSIYFDVTDCPIEVELSADSDTICKGNCTKLFADVTGGDTSKYSYTWNNSVFGTSPVTVCPTVTTTYILTVTDGKSVPGKDTITITVLTPPTLGNDTMVCLYNDPMDLVASPSGGYWSGTGITNSKKGTFAPTTAGAGIHNVIYVLGGGCLDSMKVDVRRLYGATANAACPGAAPFWAYSYSPRGGVWTGMNITPNGIITPPDKDTIFTVTYTWKGCSVNKKINVAGPQVQKRFDTMCLSDSKKRMNAKPAGGIWRGKGVTNWYWCNFDPSESGAGTHLLTFETRGCKDTTFMYVVDIDAEDDEITCPENSPFNVAAGTPAGGYWTGPGIIDTAKGTFDPSLVARYSNNTLTYHLGGCSDSKMMYVRETKIYVDSLQFCIEDTSTLLQWKSVQRTPGGGVWSGPGITGNYFVPTSASYGRHNVIYEANGCRDSIVMVIHPQAVIQKDTTLCIGNSAYTLFNQSGVGDFYGTGITNSALGIFDPKIAKVGTHKIMYYSDFNCVDSVTIIVDPLPKVSYIGLANFYCFKDTNYILTGSPAGGVFSGPGVTGDKFNPSDAGTGNHRITYTFGKVGCDASRGRNTVVGDTLIFSATAVEDSICPGESVQINTTVKGGDEFNYYYTWSSGQGDVTSIQVNPNVLTNYTVTLRDGCSDPQTEIVSINVYKKPRGSVVTSAIQCFGEDGWAKVLMLDDGNYSYLWNTSPVSFIDSIYLPVKSRHRVISTNTVTGCKYDTTVIIPGYDIVKAAFSLVPRDGCINNLKPELLVIDQSVGGITGTWDFGDNSTEEYTQNNPIHSYAADTNIYTITLIIENEGGCLDTAYVDICVDDSIVIYVPDAFTPSKRDLINPTFAIRGGGLVHYELLVFNRWGEVVYESKDITEEWDGTFGGKDCIQGLYGYRIIYKGKKTSFKEKVGAVYLLR